MSLKGVRVNARGEVIMDFRTFRNLDPEEVHKHLVKRARQ